MKPRKTTKETKQQKSARVEAAGAKVKPRKTTPVTYAKLEAKPKAKRGRSKEPKPYAENFRFEIEIPVLRRFTLIVGTHPKARATYRALTESLPKAATLASVGVDPVAIGATIHSRGQIFGHVDTLKEAKDVVAAALSVLPGEDVLVISFDKAGTPTAQHPTATKPKA
jgi:hypothetical protein